MKRIAVVAMLVASPAAAEVGRVVQAEGGLVLRGSETIVAEEGTPVDQGDLLQTTSTGLIHVLLADETKFVVGPGTSISIDTALVGSDSGTFESLAVGMTGGLLRMISGNSPKEAYQLTTPVATMGIRGTAFDTCLVREHFLVVHEGIVRTCPRNPATGEADLDSCSDSAAEANTCPVVATRVDPDGNGTVGPAEGSGVLQCRLSYEQEDLGVLEGYRIDDRACRAAADTARQATQPEGAPPGETTPPPPEEGEDETRNTGPTGSSRTAGAGPQERTLASTSNFLFGGGGSSEDDLCSKDDILETLGERAAAYEDMIDEAAGDDDAVLAYRAALNALRTAIREVRDASLRADDCDKLQARLATACVVAASPARLEDRCIIDVPNRGF